MQEFLYRGTPYSFVQLADSVLRELRRQNSGLAFQFASGAHSSRKTQDLEKWVSQHRKQHGWPFHYQYTPPEKDDLSTTTEIHLDGYFGAITAMALPDGVSIISIELEKHEVLKPVIDTLFARVEALGLNARKADKSEKSSTDRRELFSFLRQNPVVTAAILILNGLFVVPSFLLRPQIENWVQALIESGGSELAVKFLTVILDNLLVSSLSFAVGSFLVAVIYFSSSKLKGTAQKVGVYLSAFFGLVLLLAVAIILILVSLSTFKTNEQSSLTPQALEPTLIQETPLELRNTGQMKLVDFVAAFYDSINNSTSEAGLIPTMEHLGDLQKSSSFWWSVQVEYDIYQCPDTNTVYVALLYYNRGNNFMTPQRQEPEISMYTLDIVSDEWIFRTASTRLESIDPNCELSVSSPSH